MEMERNGQNEERALRAFLEPGREIAGELAGVGIGFLLGGPVGAIAGAVVPSLVAQLHRQLSEREQKRTAAVAIIAAARIQRMLDLGHEARHDGFMQGEAGHRSPAEEIAEGILISAQREHEEKKLPYLGNLLANFAFQEGLSRSDANLCLRFADRLSYRQLCLLALFGRKDEFPNLRDGTFEERVSADAPREGLFELVAVLEEADELMNAGMLTQWSMLLGGRGEGLNPADVKLFRWGAILYDLMELNEVPADELQPLADMLR
jgi:hypothetical protein